MSKEIINYIEDWNGAVNTEADAAMRNKMYECYNNFLSKFTKEISCIINNESEESSKVLQIKTLLAKFNLYEESIKKEKRKQRVS